MLFVAIPSCPGYSIADGGTVINTATRKRLCVTVAKNNRRYVKLTVFGKRIRRQVSRLLLEAFVRPARAGEQALHADDNPASNCLSNLRWGTGADNAADAKRNGRTACGERVQHAKLTRVTVRQLRRLRRSGWTFARLGQKFGVSAPTAYYAYSGKTWKD